MALLELFPGPARTWLIAPHLRRLAHERRDGLGSLWGTFLGAVVYGQVLSFGILFFPRFSIFAVFALMAAVLIIRPWGLLGRPLR